MRFYEFDPIIFESLMDPSDVEKIVSYAKKSSWVVLDEGKKSKSNTSDDKGSIVIRTCEPLYSESLKGKSEEVLNKLNLFVEFKKSNFTQPFGSKDTAFVSAGPIGRLELNIKHAHLTQDLSVVYRNYGSNPKYLDIYGVFSHHDLGTGNSPNIRAQQVMAKRLKQADCL